MILGDDRAIAATYVGGKKIHSRTPKGGSLNGDRVSLISPARIGLSKNQ